MQLFLHSKPSSDEIDTNQELVIIGSGPAGLTAAIYAARAQLIPLVIAGIVSLLFYSRKKFREWKHHYVKRAQNKMSALIASGRIHNGHKKDLHAHWQQKNRSKRLFLVWCMLIISSIALLCLYIQFHKVSFKKEMAKAEAGEKKLPKREPESGEVFVPVYRKTIRSSLNQMYNFNHMY